MKYIFTISVLLLISCKKNDSNINIFKGNIKTLQIIDSINGLFNIYHFFYTDTGKKLISITKDSFDYITIIENSATSLNITRKAETELEHYIINCGINKKVASVNLIINDSTYFQTLCFKYLFEQVDSSFQPGDFLSKMNIINYKFNFANNNCVSYTSDYLRIIPTLGTIPITETSSFIYYDSLLNNTNIPFQQVCLSYPNLWGTTPGDVISIPYIAELIGLKMGHINKNLLKNINSSDYDYIYLTDNRNMISEIRICNNTSGKTISRYLLKYY